MRFLRRLTLLALLAGLVAWLRKVLSEDVLERAAPPPPAASVGQGPVPKRAPPANPVPEASQSPGGEPRADANANAGEPSKAELYERAQQLGIEGRSKMSKAQLQRAISEAG